MTVEKDIKEAMKKEKLVIGSREVLKGIRRGTIQSVVHASNCPESLKGDLKHYANISGIELKEFKGNSAELGEFCGKPFNILLVGIKK